MPKKVAKYLVTLTDAQRTDLQHLISHGTPAARTVTHAHILLKADTSPGQPGWDDAQIAAAFNVSLATISRVRRTFVEHGLERALHRQVAPARPRKLDGAFEAHLLAIACSAPPEGQGHWTLRLLAHRVVELAYVEAVSHEAVRQTLKKTNSSPG